MKAYRSILTLQLSQTLQYRVAALAGIATQFFWGAMYVMIFTTFYGASESVNGFTRHQLIDYIWLQQAFLAFIALWYRDNHLFDLIQTGNIAYDLCRPVGIYGFWYAKLTATRLASAMLRCLPILVFASFLPQAYGLRVPSTPTAFALFIISLLLGLLLNVAISMFIYISVFVTLSPTGSLLLFSIVGEFLSGLIIPIPLMPEGLRRIVLCLPFRYTADLPFRIYSGSIPTVDALWGIGIQLLWLMALLLLGKHLMTKALKHLVIQGG